MFAAIFEAPDAAVVISAIVAVIVAILQMFPRKSAETDDDDSDVKARLLKLEFQAQTIWDFLFRRATSEVVMTGQGTANSPITFSEKYAKYFSGLENDLRDWYRKATSSGMNERDILIWMESKYGERILDICTEHRIPYGAGRLMAYAVAQDTRTIEIPSGAIIDPTLPEKSQDMT